MEDIALTKTAQGYIPFRSVVCKFGARDDAKPEPPKPESFRFELLSRDDVERVGAEAEEPGPLNLVDLATCMIQGDEAWIPDYAALEELARKSGPMFGDDSQPIDDESARAWAYASYSALMAVRMQECANGRSPVATLAALGQPRKMAVTEEVSGRSFTIYNATLRAAGEYASLFSHLEIVARLAVRDGEYLYTFITRFDDENGDGCYIDLTVVSLRREISRADFAYLCNQIINYTDEEAQGVSEQLGIASSERHVGPQHEVRGDELLSDDLQYVSQDERLVDSDIPALAALVQAMILAHIRDVRVDVFRGDRRTGYLTFGTYLSWLWYDFSGDLGTSSIGYCRNCGKPFSLVGHRGMDRLYCSRACKTEAKNAKVRADREKSRKLFMRGMTVNEVACEVYGGSKADEKRVRGDLSKWVELKHVLDASIGEHGFARSELFRRCMEQRLDIMQMLSTKRIQELRSLKSK